MDEYYKKVILNDFGESGYELVLSELESIILAHVTANSESQLDQARAIILRVSKRGLDELGKLVDFAKHDFIDILEMVSSSE